jgi:prevent-host-death family protein
MDSFAHHPAYVSVHEAKTHLSKLLQRVLTGEEIIISKSGQPVARLTPFDRPAHDRQAGLFRGQIKISDDFDAPLPEDLLKEFET